MQISKNIITGDKVRFTVLTDKMLRIEYSENNQFEDGHTQTVQNRDFGVPDFEVVENQHGHVLEIITPGFHLYYDGGALDAGSLFIDAMNNYGTYYSRWYYGEAVSKNLKGTARTLDKADGEIQLEDGLMSKDGYGVLDDSESFILEGDQISTRQHAEKDLYYFAYGRDYQATLYAYYQLTGFPPLVPRFALENWWSRYYPYTQSEYIDLMRRFDEHHVPIAVSVFDMNWHITDIPAKYGSGWTGYTWNQDYFPDPVGMIEKLHEQGRKVTLNVHPASGIRPSEESYSEVAKQLKLDVKHEQPALFDLQDVDFKRAYFDTIHHQLEKQGVDFWWIDWQQGGSRSKTKIDPLWLLNIDHYEDNERQHPGQALILSRYAGPGSHRYPVGFSGDTVASWKSLQFQPYFTATASNIGYTWWSHDIGGHMHGVYDGELALRWLQFGVFSPILRLHSSNNIFMGKEPWNYDATIEPVMIRFLQLRSQLIPYIDSANYQTHKQGIPLIRPMYYEYPDAKQSYQVPNEYLFGDAMIVSPITTPSDEQAGLASTDVWLPKGDWYDFFTGICYCGNQSLKVYREKATYPVFVKAGSILPLNHDYMQSPEALPTTLDVNIYTGTDGAYIMIDRLGEKVARTKFTWDENQHQLSIERDDPDGIIPINRVFKYHLVGASGEAHISGDALIIFDNYKRLEQTKLINRLIRQRLQFARISFDDKWKIWQTYSQATSPMQLINYLGTIEESSVSGMITELVSCL